LTVLGGFLLLFGLTSFLVRGKLFLSTAVIAIIFGTKFPFLCQDVADMLLRYHSRSQSLEVSQNETYMIKLIGRVLYILPDNWEDEDEGDQAKNILLWVSSQPITLNSS